MNLNGLKDADKYRLCRYLYKYGMSPMNDVEYDKLEKTVKEVSSSFDDVTDFFGNNFEENPFEQSYDDDTSRPTDLINSVLSPDEIKRLETMENSGDTLQSLDAYVSKSMQSYRTLEECKTWIDNFIGVPLCISPKIDGINTTTEYLNGIFNSSRTRGRAKNSVDLSSKMVNILGTNVNYNKRFIVASEAVLAKNSLETYNTILQSMNERNDELVTCRGAALSILKRKDIPDECTKLVKTFVFRTNVGDNLSDGLDIAEKLGFNVVPHEVYTFNYTSYEEYKQELSRLIWKYKEKMDTLGIPTDGLVLQVDSNSYFTSTVTNTAYDGGNLAVKALAWEPGVYTSRVVDIIMRAIGTQYNCKAQVEPTYTNEGICMQFVNLYNINNMISNNIHVGDLIEFEYVNETTINFRRKVI